MYLSTNRRPWRALALVLASSLLALLTWAPTATSAPVEVSVLTCESCLLVDLSTGDALFRRAAERPLPNASTTKMVAALVVAAEASFDDLVRVSASAAAVGGGGTDLSEGDLATVRDLLYVLLLDSSNEAAAALAEHVSGDIDSFVGLMNRTATELGATSTRFVNPHGLDESGHVSTATDLALIGQRVLDTPRIARIVASARSTVTINGASRTVENRNPLLEGYQGAVGIKTGQTLGAGEVLVAAARRGRRALIAVAMRSRDAAADAGRMLDAGFAHLRSVARREAAAAARRAARPDVVVVEHQTVGALVFDPAGATEVVAAEEVSVALSSETVAVEVRFTPSERLLLPLAKGEEIGTIEVLAGDALLATVPALAQDAVVVQETTWAGRALSGILRTAALVVAGIGA